MIIVDLDIEAINNLCKDLSEGPANDYYVVESLKSVIYPNGFVFEDGELDAELIETITDNTRGHFISGSGTDSEFIVFNTLQRTGWKVVASSDYSTLMNNANVIRNMTIISLFVGISFLIIIYLILSGSLTRPILDLQKKMKEAENGNLEVIAQSRNNDEIADLCRSFNVMISKIKELLQLTLSEQEELKKYELTALQAQINPHFLYNSLDAIVWMSEAGNRREVVKITKTLSNFFRISLSKGKDWITVRDEIEHVRSYLTIQKMRYRDIMDYTIDVPDSLMEFTILKITIQPLVENALYHGIKNRRKMGHISISCSELDNERLIFRITDDGAGMDETRLKEIRDALEDNELLIKSEGGYGLKNINQRIRLFYGKEYGIRINSSLGEGTAAEIILPKRR